MREFFAGAFCMQIVPMNNLSKPNRRYLETFDFKVDCLSA